jgi:hypothetical protein
MPEQPRCACEGYTKAHAAKIGHTCKVGDPQPLNAQLRVNTYERVAELLRAGKTHKQIAQELGVSRARIGQMAQRMLHPSRSSKVQPVAPVHGPKPTREYRIVRNAHAVRDKPKP